jgi:hypothetical protein
VIWADRVAVVWAFVAGVPLTLTAIAASDVGAQVLTHSSYFLMLAIVIGIPWLLLRMVWWAATGGAGRSRL